MPQPEEFLKWIVQLIDRCVRGVAMVKLPEFSSRSFSDDKIPPKGAARMLRQRAMLVALSCPCAGSGLEVADHFQSRSSRAPTLVLGKSFHPGDYATPFGWNVGWEAALTTVCFKSVAAAFEALLVGISESDSTRPFFFVARALHFSHDCFDRACPDYSARKSVIQEVDLSGNERDIASFQTMFGFLGTPATLRHIVSQEMGKDKRMAFEVEELQELQELSEISRIRVGVSIRIDWFVEWFEIPSKWDEGQV
jgi:hypothetical protein